MGWVSTINPSAPNRGLAMIRGNDSVNDSVNDVLVVMNQW
jgi:hypothetical protein